MSKVSKIIKSIVNAPDISIINDATDLQTIITQYEQILAALKALIAKENATIQSAGYTAIVQAAITVHTERIKQLKAKLAGTGGVSVNDVSYLVAQYTGQLDSFAYLGKQLCDGGYVDELSTLLPKYKSVLSSLITLYSTSKAAIVQSGYEPIVTGSISLHTLEIQSLETCVPVNLTLPANGIITGCRVNATVDGDTLEIDLPTSVVPADAEPRINIRLAGCNAPEKPDSATQAGNCVLEYTYDGQSSFMYVAKAFYSEATMKLGSLVGGRTVTLKVNKSKPYDSYGRLVAVVIRDDGLVANEEMLTAGLCAYFHRPEWDSQYDPVDHSKYIALESAAKVAKAGVWVTPLSNTETGQCIITAVRSTTTGGTTATTALIYVDGVYMGMTDTTDPYTLTVGEHAIRAVSSQYGIGTATVTITKGGMATVNVTIGSSTTPDDTTEKGYVTFQALRLSAAGEYIGTSAEVWENNKYKFIVESTKDRVSTEVGEHTFVFKKDGYTDKTVSVTVAVDEEVLAKAVLTASSSGTTDPTTQGTIDFISTPSGAKIYVNDEYVGLTKKLSYAVSPGVYTIWIKKTGYTDFTQTVLVEAGQKEIVDAALSTTTGGSTDDPTNTEQTGLIDFITSPTGAYIYVNNVYIGMTKKSGYKAPAGVVLVTYRKNGYDEWEDTVGITAGERIAVEATLTLSNATGTEEEEESEEEETTAGTVNWYNYPNPAYQTSTPTSGYTSTTAPNITTEPSTTSPSEDPEEDEGMPVQIIVLRDEPDKEKFTKVFKEVKAFFKKYCDTKLKIIATVQEPIEPDTNEEKEESFDDIDSIEDQLDIDKVQEDKGIVVLLWLPSGSSVAYDGETLSRDEQLNRSIVCSIPLTETFDKKIEGKKKTTLGITSEGALTMVTTMSNALLEWYLDDHEAEEEDTELPELDSEYCELKETERPRAKCVKKWLKEYNSKIED